MDTPARPSPTPARSPLDRPIGPDAARDEADAILRRAAEWTSSVRPNNPFEVFLLSQMAADALRIERCEDREAELRALAAARARYYWDNDRRIAVEELADGLRKRPAVVARKLRGSLYGCEWLLLRWRALAAPLREGRDWSDSQRARALDLLGVADDLRDGPTPVDGTLDDRLALAEARVAELAAVATGDGALAMLNAEEYRLVAKGVPVVKDAAIEATRREAERARRRLEWAWNRIRGGRADLRGAARPDPRTAEAVDDEADPEEGPASDDGPPPCTPAESARIGRAIDRMLAVPTPPMSERAPAMRQGRGTTAGWPASGRPGSRAGAEGRAAALPQSGSGGSGETGSQGWRPANSYLLCIDLL